MYHPAKTLRRKWIVSDENPTPPKLVYGWAYRHNFLRAYAEKQRLSVPLYGSIAQKLGKESVIYGELTDAEAQDEQLQRYIKDVLRRVVKDHLEELAGLELSYATPFTNDGVSGLWDNHNVEERHDDIEEADLDVDEVIAILQDTMAECEPEILVA
ncbi:hypothetical protein C8Q74DRAFT_639361 [Fomes fomentarius]|nr:hypothetical protein C8Q74DRAFT_639361 [Fomes fomentarius]